jgi:hypothetical protein
MNKKLTISIIIVLAMIGVVAYFCRDTGTTPAGGGDQSSFSPFKIETSGSTTYIKFKNSSWVFDIDQAQIGYDFGVVDIPIGRTGAASSSTGYEFGKFINTTGTAFTVASASAGFAVTMRESGTIRGCAFNLNAVPTTGTVSIMIQKNGTLLNENVCKLPSSGTFATNGTLVQSSTNEVMASVGFDFVAGDRLGLIASSSGLNAATFDGMAKLIVEINN